MNSDWISPLVIVKKRDGSLGICIDVRNVNASLKPEPEARALPDA